MSRTVIAFAVAGLTWGCMRPAAPPSQPQTAASESIWTADFMRTKPGQRDRYLRYVDSNWAKGRRTLVARGAIRSFQVLVTPPSDSAPWDVILLTEYPDSLALSRAEEIFRPVLDAQGETLVDGLSGRGPDNALKTTVLSSDLRAVIAGRTESR